MAICKVNAGSLDYVFVSRNRKETELNAVIAFWLRVAHLDNLVFNMLTLDKEGTHGTPMIGPVFPWVQSFLIGDREAGFGQVCIVGVDPLQISVSTHAPAQRLGV